MSMTKKRSLILASSSVIALGLTVGILTVNRTVITGADACDHDGYHHAAVEPGCSAGNAEYWACCKCHSKFLTNPGGTFTDWEGAEPALEEEHIAYRAPEHIFNDQLICTGTCGKTFSEAMGYSTATSKDLINPVTLSSLGQTAFDFKSDHTFVNFDFDKNGYFELNFSYKYTQHTTGGDSYYSIYLFNGRDEKGLVIQVNTDRDVGGSDVYVYRNSSTQDGAAYKGSTKVKDLPTGRHENGHYYFPFKAGLVAGTDTDSNVMSIQGSLVNKSTNEYNIVLKTGGSYANLSQLTTDYNFGEPSNDVTLNITLGATYFGSLTNPCFRFSKANATAVHASDFAKEYSTKEVVYANANGVACGKHEFASGTPIAAPKVVKTGYKFIGWCDQNGNEPNDIGENGKYIFTPRFIQDLGENQLRQTLSDFGMGDKDTTKWTNSWATGENTSTNGMVSADANTELIEVAFRYRFEFTIDDKYPIFGFTYDGTDQSARIYSRIDLINTRSTFRGYVYGKSTSLGNAGVSGTRYEDSNYSMHSGMVYLVRIQVVKNISNFTYNLIVESLGNGQSTLITRDFTYNDSGRIDFSNPLYTKFCIIGPYAPMVKDAF